MSGKAQSLTTRGGQGSRRNRRFRNRGRAVLRNGGGARSSREGKGEARVSLFLHRAPQITQAPAAKARDRGEPGRNGGRKSTGGGKREDGRRRIQGGRRRRLQGGGSRKKWEINFATFPNFSQQKIHTEAETTSGGGGNREHKVREAGNSDPPSSHHVRAALAC